MIRKIIKVSDFNEIKKEHEFFIWSFLNRKPNCLVIKSVLEIVGPHEGNCGNVNDMVEILNTFKDLPYFESLTEESVDFLMNLGIPADKIWETTHFNPIILGFRKGVFVASTLDFCYCTEGVTEVILKINPDIVKQLDI
jgi:hypothetical protein